MNKAYLLYHLVRADFLERTRRYSFLVTFGITLFFCYLCLPSLDSNFAPVKVMGHRGVYNSAWVGSMMVLVSMEFLSLAGFYLIKNAIERDRFTGVGQVLATTSMSKLFYIVGKTLSNFCVLGILLGLLAIAAIVIQMVLGEDPNIHLWSLWSPFLIIAFPTMLLIASLSVFFESFRLLRGAFGNVVYFFFWVQCVYQNIASWKNPTIIRDVWGTGILLRDMIKTAKAEFPNATGGGVGLFSSITDGTNDQTFLWEGVPWTEAFVLGRLFWIVVALSFVAMATFFFRRFDPARAYHSLRKGKAPGKDVAHFPVDREIKRESAVALPPVVVRFSFGRLLWAELHLVLKSLRWWWLVVAIGLMIVPWRVAPETAREIVLPLTWLWPLSIWSRMGTLERRHHTDQLVFSMPHALRRQLPAHWLSGVIMAVLTGCGVATHLLFIGDWNGFVGWWGGALFIPSFALALGVWSGTGKLFEALYILLWYIGPMRQTVYLDFMGTVPETVNNGLPWIFGTTWVLIGLAFWGRHCQLKH